MKKRLILTVLVFVCLLTLSACACKHETWIDANCETPKTCAECGETEGAPLGHVWKAATCETAKTCEVCGKVEGEIPGHTWVEATCEAPKTCTTCNLTEGEALGHTWVDATTEAPKTCTTCNLTEGERIITDPRFTTAATADIQGTWIYDVEVPGEELGQMGFDEPIILRVTMVLGNDGTMTMSFGLANAEEFYGKLTTFLTDMLYSEMAANGVDKATADAAMKQAYGMNVEQYAAYLVKNMGLEEQFAQSNVELVYYVEDGQLFVGQSWDTELNPTTFTLDGDKLTLDEDIAELGEDKLEFVRATE